ncbi:MAG: flavin monoamine oxidase family protein [Nocardioides sp.]|nr:flavin monoamine oxidase family protein [Nocardioides sp.]
MAGLTAARELERTGVGVTVLEARQRPGGRILNHVFDDGVTVEVGGQWVGPTQNHVLGLIDELGLETFPSYDHGDYIVSIEGHVKRFSGDTFGLPPHVLLEAAVAQKRLERMAASVPLDQPWTAAKAPAWDGQTFESWLRGNLRLERTRQFFRLVTTAIFSAEASQLSLLHFLFYCRSGGMLDRLLGTAGGAQERRVVGGTQQVADALATDLRTMVRYDEPVRSISQGSAGCEVRTDAKTYDADGVVVAIPQHLIGAVHFDPPLPPRRRQLIQSVPMGAVIKCIARYDRPFWREEDLAGFAASLDHPVSLVFDNSPPDAACGLLLGFIEGGHARRASLLTTEARRELVVGCFIDLIGPRATDVVDYVDLDWAAEPWTGGCYGGHLGPGVWTQLGPELRRPFERVSWAGTETATEWNGYIDGAVASGLRAAHEQLSEPPGVQPSDP